MINRHCANTVSALVNLIPSQLQGNTNNQKGTVIVIQKRAGFRIKGECCGNIQEGYVHGSKDFPGEEAMKLNCEE